MGWLLQQERYEPSHSSQVNAGMFSVRVEGQPVGSEVDVRFESGLEAGHAFNGSGWSTLEEENPRRPT